MYSRNIRQILLGEGGGASGDPVQKRNPKCGKSKTGKRCISGVEARVSYVRERVRERAYDILFL